MLKAIEKEMAAGHWAKAVEMCEALIVDHPGYAKLNFLLGTCRAKLGRIKEAVEPLRRAAELQPHFWQASFLLAQLLDQLGQYEPALEHAKKALKDKPGSEEIETLIRGLERNVPEKITDSWQLSVRPPYYIVDFAHTDEHEKAKP